MTEFRRKSFGNRIPPTTEEISLQVLRGDFTKIKELLNHIPKEKIELFISSTFTDTHFERNILHEIILPELQSRYREYGVQILLSDLRFGIKDENSDDHTLWELCAQEIRRCHEGSNGLFFLSLQGNKYGFRPLPKILEETIFNSKSEKLKKENRMDQLEVLSSWYVKNENTIPTRYELLPLTDRNRDKFYSTDLAILRNEILKDTSIHDHGSITINRSVTEWETKLALQLNARSCYWMNRNLIFPDHLQSSEILLYDDCVSIEDQRKLTELKTEMRKHLLKENIIDLSVPFLEYKGLLEGINNETISAAIQTSSNEYSQQWKTAVFKILEKELNRIVAERKSWESRGFGCLLPGKYLEEMLHHVKIGEGKASVFIGRNELLHSCQKIIDEGVPVYNRLQFKAISLALVGKSGCGKTALMSMLAKHYYHRYSSGIPVIIRFCGTSQYSVHAIDLVQSISLQILQIYHLNDRLTQYLTQITTLTYTQTLSEFSSLLKDYPVMIFIDSLDQLSNRDEARSRLSFLRDLKLHPRSKLIVSCLPDEFDESSHTWIYCYYCETRLKDANTPIIMVPTFAADLSSATETDAVKVLLEKLLALQQRRLTPYQMEIATQSILREPTILYFNLALKVLHRWSSSETQLELAPSVRGLVHQIFETIEINYGRKLVRTAFAFITFARAGK